MMEKITATTKKGLPIRKIQSELVKNPSRQWYLKKWVNDGRYIRFENGEPFLLTPGSVY